MRVRLKDVAERAKVSIQVASAVLNGSRTTSGAHPATRRRIEKIARELNYVRHATAASLASGYSRNVGVICHWLEDVPYHRAVLMAERRCAEHDYKLHLSRTRQTPDWAAMLQSGQVDLLLVIGLENLDLANVRLPSALRSRVIAIGTQLPPDCHVKRQWRLQYTWSADRIGVLAAEHLIGRGCRRPAMFANPYGSPDKGPGFIRRLRQEGLDGRLFQADQYHDRTLCGFDLMQRLLREAPETDGLFMACDDMFAGAALAAARRGHSLPAMVGYGAHHACLSSIEPPLLPMVDDVLSHFFAGRLDELTDKTFESTLLAAATDPAAPPMG